MSMRRLVWDGKQAFNNEDYEALDRIRENTRRILERALSHALAKEYWWPWSEMWDEEVPRCPPSGGP